MAAKKMAETGKEENLDVQADQLYENMYLKTGSDDLGLSENLNGKFESRTKIMHDSEHNSCGIHQFEKKESSQMAQKSKFTSELGANN